MKFRTKLHQAEGINATGIVVPPEIVEKLGAGKRPKVVVTVNGYSYRSTVAVMRGEFLLAFAAEHRKKAGIAPGDAISVELTLDDAPREVEVPEDFAAALKKAKARAAFDALSFTHRKEHVRGILDAKAEETRKRRIAKSVEMVLAKR